MADDLMKDLVGLSGATRRTAGVYRRKEFAFDVFPATSHTVLRRFCGAFLGCDSSHQRHQLPDDLIE